MPDGLNHFAALWDDLAAARPDPTKIALLEHELLGIDPEPGTSAAARIGAQRFAGTLHGGCGQEYAARENLHTPERTLR